MDYYIDNHRYGQGNFSTTLLVSKFYAIYGLFILAVIGIGIVTSIIMGFFLGGIDVIFEQGPASRSNIFNHLFCYLLLFIIMFWSKAYLTTRVRNYVYANTQSLDDEIQLGSNLEVMPFFLDLLQ
jgi:Predicted membrane protein